LPGSLRQSSRIFVFFRFIGLSIPLCVFGLDLVFFRHGECHSFPPGSGFSGSMLGFPWLVFYVRFSAPMVRSNVRQCGNVHP
jgi:hypothetical protein